jgi:hypothetical protein
MTNPCHQHGRELQNHAIFTRLAAVVTRLTVPAYMKLLKLSKYKKMDEKQ